VPLRAFLGFTFCFAGLQKIANPGFFSRSDPGSIRAQLQGAARSSPIHALMSPLVHVAVPVGVLIALGELAVGIGTLAGLLTRVAAAGGMLLSLGLFLTVSFHSSPYYTGSDIVFLFAWTPLLLAGSGGVLSADAVLANVASDRVGAERDATVQIDFATVRRVCGQYDDGRCKARKRAPCEPAPCPFLAESPSRLRRIDVAEIDRREFALKGAFAAAAAGVGLLAAGITAGLGRLAGGTKQSSVVPPLKNGASGSRGTGSAPPPGSTPSSPPAGGSGPQTTPTTSGAVPPGTPVGPAVDVPVGGAASFTDPSSGDPAIVVQPQAGKFVAFDAVCPHAGCTVGYSPAHKLFQCPCHGSEFSGRTGQLVRGPATTGLTAITIQEGPDGQLYAR
jgi:thiosulfate dehydrogenase [quinone] large subunit